MCLKWFAIFISSLVGTTALPAFAKISLQYSKCVVFKRGQKSRLATLTVGEAKVGGGGTEQVMQLKTYANRKLLEFKLGMHGSFGKHLVFTGCRSDDVFSNHSCRYVNRTLHETEISRPGREKILDLPWVKAFTGEVTHSGWSLRDLNYFSVDAGLDQENEVRVSLFQMMRRRESTWKEDETRAFVVLTGAQFGELDGKPQRCGYFHNSFH